MKKYVTFVKDAEESRKVQEALFSAGFTEASGETKTWPLDANFVFVDPYVNRCYDFDTVGEYANKEKYIFLNARAIIADPFQLDGAKQPEATVDIDGKEFSVSTIKAALKQYVE